jgi:hypothetical protein
LTVPEEAEHTTDDIVDHYESGAVDVQRMREVFGSLGERLSNEKFASSKVTLDEVDCRGDACKIKVSFAEDAAIEPILLELAAAIPDGNGMQEVVAGENHRRVIISHNVARGAAAGAR